MCGRGGHDQTNAGVRIVMPELDDCCTMLKLSVQLRHCAAKASFPATVERILGFTRAEFDDFPIHRPSQSNETCLSEPDLQVCFTEGFSGQHLSVNDRLGYGPWGSVRVL